MGIHFWAATDVGRQRKVNQDNFLVDKRLRLFVVCDGMGGHAAGEVASAIGVQTVRDAVVAQSSLVERVQRDDGDPAARAAVCALLVRALEAASAKVFRAAQEDPAKRGMGTTCSALVLTKGWAFLAHVGDSRAYRLRGGRAKQLTQDHSLYNEMVKMGKIKPGEQDKLPNKNAVTRAIGIHHEVEVDVQSFQVKPGDRFLLCSDGLSGYFEGNDHAGSMMRGDSLKAIAQRCIQFALESGGKDNITVVLVEPGPTSRPDPKLEARAAGLGKCALFAGLGQAALRTIAKSTSLRRLSPGAPYEARVQAKQVLAVVVAGKLERAGEVARGPGAAVGVIGFVDGARRQVVWHAGADQGAQLLEVPRASLTQLLAAEPAAAAAWSWNLMQQLCALARGAESARAKETPGERTRPIPAAAANARPEVMFPPGAKVAKPPRKEPVQASREELATTIQLDAAEIQIVDRPRGGRHEDM